MSFPKAQIRRFNDGAEDTPGPNSYNIKLEAGNKGGPGIGASTSKRFQDPKDAHLLPGPGHYNTDKVHKPVIKGGTLPRSGRKFLPGNCSVLSNDAGSATSSTCSLNSRTPGFKTPSKVLTKGDSTIIHLKKKIEDLQVENDQLELQRLDLRAQMDQTKQDLTTQLDLTNEELEAKSQQLSDLNSELAAAKAKGDEADTHLAELVGQLESVQSANEELAKNKAALEECLQQEKANIVAERQSLEEKCTFLHFTQEQLNSQVEELDRRCQQLTTTIDHLKAELAQKADECASVQLRLKEFGEVYEKENKELGEDFIKIKAENQELMAQAESVNGTNSKLADDNLQLESELKQLRSELETERYSLKGRIEALEADLDVANNDKGVLESEMNRLDKEKTAVELDLAQVAAEKNRAEADLQAASTDRDTQAWAVNDLQAKLRESQTALEEATGRLAATEAEASEATQRLKAAQKDLGDQITVLKYNLDVANREKTEAEAESSQLSEARTRLEAEKKAVQDDLEAAVQQKGSLESELGTVAAASAEKAEAVARLEGKLAEGAAQLEESRSRLAGLQSQLSDMHRQSEALQSTLADKQNTVDEKEASVAELKSELEEMEMKNSSLEGALCSSQSEVTNLVAENKTLFASFESVEETLRSYIHQCQDLQAEVEELKGAKADLNDTCMILEKQVNELTEKVANDETQLTDMAAEYDTQTSALEAANSNANELAAKVSSLQELVGLLEERNNTDKEIMQASSEQHDREVTEVRAEVQRETDLRERLEAELKEGKQANAQLLEMNEELSTRVSDNLHAIKALQDREAGLQQRLEAVKAQLESAQQGLSVELDNHWAAEDEVLSLQSEIDQLTVQLKESESAQTSLRAKLTSADAQRSQALETIEKVKSDHQKHVSKVQQELEIKTKELEKKSEVESTNRNLSGQMATLKSELDTASKALRKQETDLKNAKKLTSSEAERANRLEAKLKRMEDDMAGVEVLTARFQESQGFLQEYMEENAALEEGRKEDKAVLEEKAALIARLQEQLDRGQEEASYKAKFEALTTMIEPFKEQLESYELEKAALLNRNQEVQGEVKKLASQYGQLLGHQNHKQKIQHLVKLKQDNVTMREEMAAMRLELDKYRRLALKHEKLRLPTANKENCNNTAATIPKTPSNSSISSTKSSLLSSLKKPDFSLLACVSTPRAAARRQTIASPLSSHNRPL